MKLLSWQYAGRGTLFFIVLMLSANLLLAAGPGSAKPCDEIEEDSMVKVGIEILALSRGRGVPEDARQVYGDMKRHIEKVRADLGTDAVVGVSESTIGIEGEKRLCIEIGDTEAARMLLRELEQMAEGVDLLTVTEKSCRDDP